MTIPEERLAWQQQCEDLLLKDELRRFDVMGAFFVANDIMSRAAERAGTPTALVMATAELLNCLVDNGGYTMGGGDENWTRWQKAVDRVRSALGDIPRPVAQEG